MFVGEHSVWAVGRGENVRSADVDSVMVKKNRVEGEEFSQSTLFWL